MNKLLLAVLLLVCSTVSANPWLDTKEDGFVAYAPMCYVDGELVKYQAVPRSYLVTQNAMIAMSVQHKTSLARVILVDYDMAAMLSPAAQQFLWAHECAHQVLKHVDEWIAASRGEQERVSPERAFANEKTADCWALNKVKTVMKFKAQQLREIPKMFLNQQLFEDIARPYFDRMKTYDQYRKDVDATGHIWTPQERVDHLKTCR